MNYIGTTNYRDNDVYNQMYGGMIENFIGFNRAKIPKVTNMDANNVMKNEGRGNRRNNRNRRGNRRNNKNDENEANGDDDYNNLEELEKSAKKLWVSKSNGSNVYNMGGNANMTRTIKNGRKITLLQRVVKMSDKEFNEAFYMLKRNSPKYVSKRVLGKFCETDVIHLEDNGFQNKGICALKIYREQSINGISNADISNTIEKRNELEQNDIRMNTTEPDDDLNPNDDHELRQNQYIIEQDTMVKGQQMQDTYDKNVQIYEINTTGNESCKKNTVDLEAKTKYINKLQENVIEDNNNKNIMLKADIQTKDRQIQINRYEYFKKKSIIFYCKLIIVIAGILAIIYSIGLKFPDKRYIFNILSVSVLIIGLFLIGMKIKRDSMRDNLDWDAIEFASYEWDGYGKDIDDSTVKTCSCPSEKTDS